MTLPELLQSLANAGFSCRLASCDSIEISGPTDRLTEGQRLALRLYKPQLLALLAPAVDYEQEERAAIRFADTPDSQRYLDYATQLFGPGDMRVLDTPQRIAQHKHGLISGAELDAWLSQCKHDPTDGTWHYVGGDKCCRYCGGLYESIVERVAKSDTKAKSEGAATPTLF